MADKYLKSKYFLSSIGYLLLFATLLIVPSFIYFNNLKPTFTLIFDNAVNDKLLFTKSKYKFMEILPWFLVAITAILVMAGNTLIYFMSFVKEMFNENIKSTSKYYYWTLFFFIVWILCFFAYSIYTTVEFYSLRNSILDLTKQAPSLSVTNEKPDLLLTNILAQFLNDFVHLLELYIGITITLFIAIDSLSLALKPIQIKAAKGKTKLALHYERDFIMNQLLVIDIPVLLGITLIYIFTSNLSDTDICDTDAKSVFTVGGIAMHIILSQIVFLVLTFKNSFREHRLYNK